MRKIERLRLEALVSCKARGHDISRFRPVHNLTPGVKVAYCVHCTRRVYIDTNPYPNGTEIIGEAVAVNCTAVAE